MPYRPCMKLAYYNSVMFFIFYNVTVLFSTRQCLCSTVYGLISNGVSFTLPIVTELAILSLKFWEYFHRSFYLFASWWTSELRCRTFLSRCIVDVVPHKYFNNIATIMCCGSQAQHMCMYTVRICMQHSVSFALVTHNTYIKCINNNLLRNQSVIM